MKTKKKMEDGTIGHLTQSKRYYVRREPEKYNWTSIIYYTLKGKHIPLAKATCTACGDVMESQYCGDFQQCSCGESAVDTDRWMPERHRYIGNENSLMIENQ